MRFYLWMALTVFAFSAQAAEGAKGPLDVSKPAEQVTRQVSSIRQELGDGKTYAEIGADKRVEVEGALTRILAAVTRSNGGALAPNEQLAVFNDQEVVNTILSKARDDSRLVCKRERAVGSNMMTSQCMTVAQRREQQRQSQKEMNNLQRNKSQLDLR